MQDLTQDQWAFLGVLAVFDGPISIELAGQLAPLMPGPLMTLLSKAEKNGWIDRIDSLNLRISKSVKEAVVNRIRTENGPEFLPNLVQQIISAKLENQIAPDVTARLFFEAGRIMEASEIEKQMADRSLEGSNYSDAYDHLFRSASYLEKKSDQAEAGGKFVQAVQQLSTISFALGRGLAELDSLLQKAHAVAARIGDQRSHALINLHLGRLYYFTDRRDDALVALSIGANEIEALGDEDIQAQSAVFLGMYYFIQGLFGEAFDHFEKAERLFEKSTQPFLEYPMVPLFLGYCAIYLGQFHRAIGSLDYYWRLARKSHDKGLSSAIRAVLGLALILIKRPQRAAFHLKQAQKEAAETRNALGSYFCGGALSLRYFNDGQIDKAYETISATISAGARAGLVRQFSSPWILEMFYEFHRLGFEPLPDFEFHDVMDRIFRGVNIHLTGVALRLIAKEAMSKSVDRASIRKDLDQSADNLNRSGDPIQHSKTLVEIAKLELGAGNREQAHQIAQRARRLLGGYFEEFYPSEFRHLIENQGGSHVTAEANEANFNNFLEMIESLYPSENRTEILARVLTATSRMFGAERSGFFWFKEGQQSRTPELRAASHLSSDDIAADQFAGSLKLVLRTIKSQQPLRETLDIFETFLKKKLKRAVLCIPIQVRGRVYGVLCYDNSYIENAFDFIDLGVAKRMADHTNMVIERRFAHLEMKQRVEKLASEKKLRQQAEKSEIVSNSKTMKHLMTQADRIADTNSTVLLTGETGTGKELFAKYIHNQSARANAPFIIVDLTTIPETLLESELFGHEKGAFTGADQRKIGRIELADRGTLFLDEIGELALQAQVKLLRALQERSFNRVGGIRTISSDFRLIAATNRDLANEVGEGRFREDLYYRLNVVPLTLPPLRERGKDALLIARHFTAHYARKYNRQIHPFSAENEEVILKYHWPGNVRELQNIIERAVILSVDGQMELNLPSRHKKILFDPFQDKPTLDEIQKRYIQYIIDYTGGKISGPGGAADVLGMKRTSLYSRMKALGMKKR